MVENTRGLSTLHITIYKWRTTWQQERDVVLSGQVESDGGSPADKLAVVLETAGMSTAESVPTRRAEPVTEVDGHLVAGVNGFVSSPISWAWVYSAFNTGGVSTRGRGTAWIPARESMSWFSASRTICTI